MSGPHLHTLKKHEGPKTSKKASIYFPTVCFHPMINNWLTPVLFIQVELYFKQILWTAFNTINTATSIYNVLTCNVMFPYLISKSMLMLTCYNFFHVARSTKCQFRVMWFSLHFPVSGHVSGMTACWRWYSSWPYKNQNWRFTNRKLKVTPTLG